MMYVIGFSPILRFLEFRLVKSILAKVLPYKNFPDFAIFAADLWAFCFEFFLCGWIVIIGGRQRIR